MTSTPPALALAERRPVVLAFRAVLVVLAVAGLANLLGSALNDSEPSDLAINLVAAEHRPVDPLELAVLVGLLIAVALLALPVDRPRPQAVAEDWLLRVTPNVGLAAVAVLLALAVLTLAPGRDRAG